MARNTTTVADRRKYAVTAVADARKIVLSWIESHGLHEALSLGLPEIDDRHHVWRVPLKRRRGSVVGEAVIDAFTTELLTSKSTDIELVESRLLKKQEAAPSGSRVKEKLYRRSALRNTISSGNCIDLLEEMPAESVDLVFTSPPYYNARPEYSEYEDYEEYLLFMRKVIHRCARVLHEGRFFAINISPVLVRRASRNESSRRIAVPYDLHEIFIQEGFEFVDDIIWLKPEGAGWATGRGRRFAADRNPVQYKAVPVTEYILVYRKKSRKLIDWFIRNHYDQQAVERSKIGDGYEKTNVWKINPATRGKHPAAFPLELATKVIQYYSFETEVVLDPFAGSGTSGEAAAKLGRRFVLHELDDGYVELMKQSVSDWMGKAADQILWQGTEPANPSNALL